MSKNTASRASAAISRSYPSAQVHRNAQAAQRGGHQALEQAGHAEPTKLDPRHVKELIGQSLRDFEYKALNPRRLAEQSQRSLAKRLTRERERLGK
jgi:hypothetical protein